MNSVQAFRGSILHFVDDPLHAEARSFQYFDDGALVLRAGTVAALGGADLLSQWPDAELTDYRGKLIVPGFIDTHVHYAQTDAIAACGGEMLAWLERSAFPAEQRFGDTRHAREVADFFLDELLRNGTTTAMVFATVHPQSVDALFEAAAARALRLIAGKVLMDRNCPESLRDTAAGGYEDSARLIARWHRRGRLLYAVTPRFAPTSSEEQLRLAGRLLDEHGGLYLQSHVAETRRETDWVAQLFPWSRSYLDVYDRFGLLRERSVYAHCIHLDAADRRRMAQAQAAMAFCPTSNLFLGSGLFDLEAAAASGARLGVGTDVGGGTSFSMLRTLAEAYKVAQMAGHSLSPLRAFYLATLGSARALHLDHRIGSFERGREGDFIVLDPDATPLLARRMRQTENMAERLFLWMMLGDDRAIHATHVMGRRQMPASAE